MRSFVENSTGKVHRNHWLVNLRFDHTNILPRNSDELWFDAIKIPLCEIDNIKSIEISTRAENIWDIPFNLLKYLCKIDKTKTHYIINIPQRLYSNNGLLFLLMKNSKDICLNIRTFKGSCNKFSLFINSQYYDDKIKSRCSRYTTNSVNKYIEFDVFYNGTIINCTLYGLKGFFIEFGDTCNIGFKLRISDEIFMHYNDELARYHSKEIYNYWNEEHYMELVYLQRRYGLPKEILKLIVKYVDKRGMFWFPLVSGKSWTSSFKTTKLSVCRYDMNFKFKNFSKSKIYFVDSVDLIYENGNISIDS